MVRVVCINDENRPAEIAPAQWLKAWDVYRLTEVAYCLPQNEFGFSLYEKPLGEDCAPYEYFLSYRFAVIEEDLQAFIEFVEQCTELSKVKIDAIIKESNLKTVPAL